MAATLTDAEKDRIRYHLGYPSTEAIASASFGIPALRQPAFLIESAMNTLLEVSLPRVRQVLTILDNLECKLVEAQDRLAAEQLGDLRTRSDELSRLEVEYNRWAMRLADIFAVPIYGYAARFLSGGGRAGNIRRGR